MDDLTREFVAESQEGLERMERCLTELERRPGDRALVAEVFRAVHTIKGATGFLGFGRLEALAHAGESLLGAVRAGRVGVTEELIGGLLRLMDGLREVLRVIERTGGEGQRSTDDDGALLALLAELGAGSPAASSGWAGVAVPVEDKTLRVDLEALDRMMNLVGELVLTRNRIVQNGAAGERFGELSRRLDAVTGQLREAVMRARMQPVEHLFGKFPRMVRDLAHACGRKVRLEFEGQATALDKGLLETVRDPLTHAVRNAVDHGIEPPEERVRAGKPAEGTVRLRAFHHGGWVVIEVSDDGAGIAVEAVRARAVEQGLVTAEQAGQRTEREALQLVFMPGFSMAREVTTVSGRGVGMDVVRTNVEKAGGSVELESRVGKGTTLRLRVPLTLAIVPALVVRSAGMSFAVPQSALVELVHLPAREVLGAVERIGGVELYRLRDRLLPLVWLDRVLELPSGHGAEERGAYVAVVESEGLRYGLVVDDLPGPEEIVVKPVSGVLRALGVYSGATVLGNGTLALILDVAAVAERAGVRPVETVRTVSPGKEDGGPLERQVVVYEVQPGERMAIPLTAVERIATLEGKDVEFARGRPVVQFRGELMPLEDEGGRLQGLLAGDEASLPVMVVSRPGLRRTGVVVRRVLEIAGGTEFDEASGPAGAVRVGGRAIDLHPEFGLGLPQRAALPERAALLQEVA